MRPSRRLAAALGVAVSLAAPATAAAVISAESSGPTVLMWQNGPTVEPVDMTVSGDGDAITAVSRNGVLFGPPPWWSGASGLRLCTGQDSPTTTCTPPEGFPRLLGMSPILSSADDVFDASSLEGVGLVVAAKEGNDVVRGGSGDDGLTGWTGVDELHGGPGNDYLYLDSWHDQGPDPDSAATTCGPGTDVVKRDFEDPPLARLDGCELEIPAFSAPPTVAGTATPGSALSVAEPGSTGTGTPAQYAWRTCAPGGACGDVVATTPTYTPTAADVGREVTAHISRSVTAPDRVWAAAADARSAPVAAAPATKPAPTSAKDTTAPAVAVRKALKATAARTGRVTLKLGRASESGTATLRLSLKGRTAGRAKVTLTAGRTATARLRLPARVRRALRRPKTLAAVLTTADAAGNTATERFEVTLRTKGRSA